MKILKLISYLLDYPIESISEQKDELIEIVRTSALAQNAQNQLTQFIEQLAHQDLMDRQVEYEGLFERGRALGLWLFEHVHGEGRDRGQAMVDLIQQYREAGLEIDQKELPDYLPLFLEFLSTQGSDNAKAWLIEVEHILALLQVRLENRGSQYAVLFKALLEFSDSHFDPQSLRNEVSKERPDHTNEALDKVWEEEEVTFGTQDNQSCQHGLTKPMPSQRRDDLIPIGWADFNQNLG